MPFSIIPFLFLIVPIAEIAAFITIGGQIGILWTFALILITAVIGTILLRVQGFQIVNKLREETNAGRIPGKELGHAAMILVAGVLLLTPGFVTDSLGFVLFIPLVRTLIWSLIASKVKIIDPLQGMGAKMGGAGGPFSGRRTDEEGVVELDPDEFEDLDQDQEPDDISPSGNSPNSNSPWRDSIPDKSQGEDR